MPNPTEVNQSTLAIDGTAAQLELNLAAKGKDPLFRYRDPTVTGGWRLISRDVFIGIDQDTTHATYTILYLEVDPAANKPDSSHTTFRAVDVQNTPPALLASLDKLVLDGNGSYLRSLVQHQRSTRVQVIVSVASGVGHAKTFFQDVLQPFLRRIQLQDAAYDIHHTTSDQTIIELARSKLLPEAQNGVEQAVILLSGDGGMIDILNVLYEKSHTTQYRSPNVAILSLGTGNALANSSVGQHDNTFGLRSLFSGTPVPLPTFRTTFSSGSRLITNEGQDETKLPVTKDLPTAYGAVVCSWGFHATLVADSDTVEYRKHGADRFQMAAKEALFPADGSAPHAYRGTVKVLPVGSGNGWRTLEDSEYGYVLATFMSQLEAGFTISPDSLPLDGKLRLIHFGALKGEEIMDIMQKAYNGGAHVRDDRVHYEEIDGLRIELHEDDARWRRVCIDGRIVRTEANGWFEVRNHVEPAVDLITS